MTIYTSESTNHHDPSWSIRAAYRALIRQWGPAFRIGRLNRVRGHRGSGLIELARCVLGYDRDRRIAMLAD